MVNPSDFPAAVIHAFDELLESTGTGARLEKWRVRLSAGLAATSHDQYAEAIATLGRLLGYSATRPRYGAATDCRWRGVFGNHCEAVTWEAKIEHENRTSVSASDVGQAHNQLTRAETELGNRGYLVRGTIVTHLADLDAAAAASGGAIKVIRNDAVGALWTRVNQLLGAYSGEWSADTPEPRLQAADHLAPRLPPTGWLGRTLSAPAVFVEAAALLSEWPS